MTIDIKELVNPWMVAVWPGMGQVAISAGYYLMAKLEMHAVAEFSPHEFFDVEHVHVKEGLIEAPRFPRSRLFAWKDPAKLHDIVVFLGDAQPTIGKYAFCRALVEYAKQMNVQCVYTFAAMATQMRLGHESRVFCAATDEQSLQELRDADLKVLEEGQIGGLNGLLLGAVASAQMRGACLLGEMPHVFAQLPFPKASLMVLEAFQKLVGIDIDLTELSTQAKLMEERLGVVLAQAERAMKEQAASEEEPFIPESPSEIDSDDRGEIDALFTQAERDRSRAYELKQELDRRGLFKEYEDRFLDLFKRSEAE